MSLVGRQDALGLARETILCFPNMLQHGPLMMFLDSRQTYSRQNVSRCVYHNLFSLSQFSQLLENDCIVKVEIYLGIFIKSSLELDSLIGNISVDFQGSIASPKIASPDGIFFARRKCILKKQNTTLKVLVRHFLFLNTC